MTIEVIAAVGLPLLHVVQAATKATAVDPRVVAPAALLAALTVGWLIAPRPFTVRRLVRARPVRAALGLLVALAVLPSVVPYDHLVPDDHHAGAADVAVHAAHCHVAPGSCADAPLAAGPGQLIFAEPAVVAPAMLSVLIVLATPALRGISLRPDTRPPRPVTSA